MRFLDRGGDPAARTQRDLEAKLKGAVDRRVDNAVRTQAAEAKLTEARSNVEALALEADDAALDRALQSRRAVEDKLFALRGAALAIGKEISDIEAQIDKVVDQRCRAETSIAVNAMADELAEAQAAFTKAAERLEAAARQGGLLIPEGRAVAEFTLSALTQLPPAVEMVIAGLRQHAQGVLSGHAPASLPRPAAPAPKLAIVPPPTPTLTLFATKKLKYLDAAGAVIVVGAYHQHTFPQALGELALRTNVAVALNDKRARDFQAAGLATVGTPDEASCEWLGEPGAEAPDRYLRPGGAPEYRSLSPSPFTPVDRGGPFTVRVPRPAEPEPMPLAVGQRNAEDDQS